MWRRWSIMSGSRLVVLSIAYDELGCPILAFIFFSPICALNYEINWHWWVTSIGSRQGRTSWSVILVRWYCKRFNLILIDLLPKVHWACTPLSSLYDVQQKSLCYAILKCLHLWIYNFMTNKVTSVAFREKWLLGKQVKILLKFLQYFVPCLLWCQLH